MPIQKYFDEASQTWKAVDSGAINDGVNKFTPAQIKAFQDSTTSQLAENAQLIGEIKSKAEIYFLACPIPNAKTDPLPAGDSTLIRIPEGDSFKNVLIDTHVLAHNQSYITPRLKEIGVEVLDYVIITHFHEDHAAGVAHLANNFTIRNFIIPPNIDFSRIPGMTPVYYNLLIDTATLKGINVITATENMKLNVGIGEFTFMNTDFEDYFSPFDGHTIRYNNFSLLTHFKYGSNKVFIASDLEWHGQYKFKDKVTACDIYRTEHHGYNDFLNETYINNLNPSVAVISRNIDKMHTKSWTWYEKNNIKTHVAFGKDVIVELSEFAYTFIQKNESKPNDTLGSYDRTNSPGSLMLKKGNSDAGFFDILRFSEMGMLKNGGNDVPLNAINLASVVGLTTSAPIDDSKNLWLKFMYKGKVLFIPTQGLQDFVSWDTLYQKGLVYGTDDEGFLPPAGRVGKQLSINATDKSINSNRDIFLGDKTPGTNNADKVANVGDKITLKGWNNPQNNGEFTVVSITNNKITVAEPLVTETGNDVSRVYNSSNKVTQNKTVQIGKTVYKVRLMKGFGTDPVSSYNDFDRGTFGGDNEWNSLLLPLLEKARTNSWYYAGYAKDRSGLTLEYWGLGMNEDDLRISLSFGRGFRTLCQETLDTVSYNRGVRGFNGLAEGVTSHGSWHTSNVNSWRPVLEVMA